LASEDNGWHFGASRATTKQMEEFSLKRMVENTKTNAPQWWRLLGRFLSGEEVRDLRSRGQSVGDDQEAIQMDDTPEMDDSDDYWDQVDEVDLEGFISGLAEERASRLSMRGRRERRRLSSVMMVCVKLIKRQFRLI
ncbi:hypothetical protein L210DRAFT_3432426, partial [Boletus edulis BED1]